MGFYLNPGNGGFRESIRSKIYVDKTGLLAHTNEYLSTEQKYMCVSRPRRFGKSMALKMLAAYYSRGCDSRKLFEGLKIENDPQFSDYLNQYDVIFLNIQQFLIEAKNGEVTEYLEREVLREVRKEYGEFLTGEETGLASVLRQIYVETGQEFIFLVDEWDCVMRERQESEEMQKQYLDFLRNLLKDQPYVALAYMTGILPVKKIRQSNSVGFALCVKYVHGIFHDRPGYFRGIHRIYRDRGAGGRLAGNSESLKGIGKIAGRHPAL